MQTILDRLTWLMKNEGLNAKQLTKELEISNSSFTDWKKGKGSPSLEIIIKFAKRYHVTLDWIVFGDEQNDSKLLDYSNPMDAMLMEKFHSLSPELQSRLFSFLDGMIAAMPKQEDNQQKLSV